jgi:hypothetical protein
MPKKLLQVKDLILGLKKAMDDWIITDETPIIYSQDDEGNWYQWCVFWPSVMYANKNIKYWEHIDANAISNDKDIFSFLCIN